MQLGNVVLFTATNISFHLYEQHILQIKKETTNVWEYKVGNNANIASFVLLWKIRLHGLVI